VTHMGLNESPNTAPWTIKPKPSILQNLENCGASRATVTHVGLGLSPAPYILKTKT